MKDDFSMRPEHIAAIRRLRDQVPVVIAHLRGNGLTLATELKLILKLQ